MSPRRSPVRRFVTGVFALAMAAWVSSALAVYAWGKRDDARASDAIVVLGAAQYSGRPSPVLKARLDHGIALWKDSIAPVLVLTGGTGDGDTTSEAAVGRRYAMNQGVPFEAILVEAYGRTTVQSMRSVADMASQHDFRSVVLVSDPFHMLRVKLLAMRYGLDASTSPTRTSPISEQRQWSYVIGESLKVPVTLFWINE
jgi:uncharacterized SAM-binding protein YcdF (DUF218 family)